KDYKKLFIISTIQVTHRGNPDGKQYTIQTPQPSAFSHLGGGETFTPLQNREMYIIWRDVSDDNAQQGRELTEYHSL
ncbi:hypothetical protein, partial [Methanocalculus sp.]|uniref:hypothetical protein n=1 Tax=Methanocalculus sp. TaxID=2004547 RepID=UPI0027173D77